MIKKQIDLKILIDNDNYLKEYLVDNNESITPTTDKGYFSFEKAIEKLQKSEEEAKKESKDVEISSEDGLDFIYKFTKQDTVFIKNYSHDFNGVNVLRFGVNTKKEGLGESLFHYNKNIRDSLSGNFLEKMSNISGESNYGKFIKAVQPTDIEKNIIETAIHYLMNYTSNKVVLVDVFPRVLKETESNKVGTIDLTEGVESHTALLYKTLDNKILVIDPNNPQFSAFLQNIHPCIQSSYRADDKIYTRGGESGPESWRDCIDIAVKLGFILNHSKEDYPDIKSIIKSPEIKLITNNPVIDENIFYSKNKVFREKQTSDLEKIILFNKNLEHKAILFNKQQDFLTDAKENAEKKLLNIFEDALISNSDITAEDFNKEILGCFLMQEDY